MTKFQFQILSTDSKTRGRVGEIHTPHGIIHTPAFTPVGTQATVKSLSPQEIADVGTEMFFVNTYHAYLRPGVEVIEKAGGLHRFMNWNGAVITDSGGFQVFSLGRDFSAQRQNLVKIDEEGVTFQSHWDGSTHRFTPEVSITIQHQLGADLIIAFDECTPYPVSEDEAWISLRRTHRWAKRSLLAHNKLQKKEKNKPYKAIYGVVQGSVYKDLRIDSAKTIAGMDFDGIAIGGLAVGESKKETKKVCEWVVPQLPEHKPRHLLGVGEIDDIFTLVEQGIDTFDCVQPTRLARMGQVFRSGMLEVGSEMAKLDVRSEKKFIFDITKKEYAQDLDPIERGCGCYTCQNFSRAYIHHLFRVRELLAYRLATIHNLFFVHALVAQIRTAIIEGKFSELKKKWISG